jgi:hypothetical protein
MQTRGHMVIAAAGAAHFALEMAAEILRLLLLKR